MDIVDSAVTSEEANLRLPPQPPPPSTTKSFTALSPKRKNNHNSSRTTSPTKLIEAAVKSANYSGKFSLNGDVYFLFQFNTIMYENQSKYLLFCKKWWSTNEIQLILAFFFIENRHFFTLLAKSKLKLLCTIMFLFKLQTNHFSKIIT